MDNVSLEISPGETFGIVGESACRKSTLGKSIMGIYRPTEGKAGFKGRDITVVSKKESIRLRKEIQYVYQDSTISLHPHWKIRNILAEPPLIHTNLKKHAIRTTVLEMLDAVGLGEEHLNLYPHELSGGQQRRLGLARILCLNPSLVIVDEPTSGLDVSVQATILNLLLDVMKRFRLTYVFISHKLSVVRMICHRMADVCGPNSGIRRHRRNFHPAAPPLNPYFTGGYPQSRRTVSRRLIYSRRAAKSKELPAGLPL